MNARAVEAARRAWRTLPMSVRRRLGGAALRAVEPLLASRLPSADPALFARPADSALLCGLFSTALGHGSAVRLLEAELRAGGVACPRHDLTRASGAERAPDTDAAADQSPPAAADAAILALNPDTAIVALQGAPPQLLRGRRVIGYWVWETEKPPARWAAASRLVHEIWTPSAYSAAGLQGLFEQPVRVVPHPVALSPPPSLSRADARASLDVGPDTFLAVTSFTTTSSLARKNPAAAIRAFEDAFAPNQDCLLILRCLGGARYPEALAALKHAVRDSRARIRLIDAPGGIDELHQLYAACDVYLSLHRAEGFGLNLAEAMVCERAVIATAYSGPLEFTSSEAAALVPYRLAPISDPQGIYGGRGQTWAEPDHEAAVETLRRLARDSAHRARIAVAGRALALQRLSGGAAARALKDPSSNMAVA